MILSFIKQSCKNVTKKLENVQKFNQQC